MLAERRFAIGGSGDACGLPDAILAELQARNAEVLDLTALEPGLQARAANEFDAVAFVGLETMMSDVGTKISYFSSGSHESVPGRTLATAISKEVGEILQTEPQVQGMRFQLLRETKMAAAICALSPEAAVVERRHELAGAIVAALDRTTDIYRRQIDDGRGQLTEVDRVVAAIEWALSFNHDLINALRDENSQLRRELADLQGRYDDLIVVAPEHLVMQIRDSCEHLEAARRRPSLRSRAAWLLVAGVIALGSQLGADLLATRITWGQIHAPPGSITPVPTDIGIQDVVLNFCIAAVALDPTVRDTLGMLPFVD